MDNTELKQLIAGGETLGVEFKRGERKSFSDNDLVEAVVCMANGPGGHVLIGVADDGSVTGAEPRHPGGTDPHLVRTMVLNRTEPNLVVDVFLVPVGDKEVLVIEVPRSPSGPVGTKDGLFKRRTIGGDGKPACVPYRPSEMLAASFTLTGTDYATLSASGATMGDLDPAEFERFRRLCSRDTGDEGLRHLSNEKLLTALRLSGPPGDPSGISLGAILLFGTTAALNRWVPTSECLFQDERDATARVNETLRFPLIRLAEELAERIAIRNTHTELYFGLHRVDLPLVTERTSREAVANALIHRDYSELGPITVRFSNDALTVNSPGGFPYGVTLSTMLDDSRPRSVALADAFKRAGLVERRGQGINDMFVDQLRTGRSVPDYSGTNAYNVAVALPMASADLDMVRFIVTFEDRNQATLDLGELRILHELKDAGSLALTELADDLHLAKEKTRSTLTRLTAKGLVEARGNGRSRRYHLAATFYALAEDRNAYVRLRGRDVAQNEQMILDYVRSYGRITRAQAADLCQLAPPAASRILRGLADRGLLQMRGEKRSAHYISPSPSPA